MFGRFGMGFLPNLLIPQGWMNEIHSYDPEMYHATLTHSVYVRLEGSVLRLSKPNRNISRRAAHNEPKTDVTFVSQKIYDLADSKVRRPRVRCKEKNQMWSQMLRTLQQWKEMTEGVKRVSPGYPVINR